MPSASDTFPLIAKTLFGLEDVLAKELHNLGAQSVEKGVRLVRFEGNRELLYKSNLCLRTALRILKPVFEFYFDHQDGFYNGVQAVDWAQHLSIDQTFLVDAVVHSDILNHSGYTARLCKDAIVDQFRDRTGKRPGIDKEAPDVRIHVHISGDHCTIALDSSGESLHKRGYRKANHVAPINEVLAAGLVQLIGWDATVSLLDPMCGSGTLLIEAAMLAKNFPPQAHRANFAFQKWPDWQPNLFESVKADALAAVKSNSVTLQGYDIDATAVSQALENIQSAGFTQDIRIEQLDFFGSAKKTDTPLTLLFNPPYGARLHISPEAFYKSVGDTLKKQYAGSTAWLISSNLEALKYVGLRPSRRIKVYNGNLESRLVRYDLYAGSKRTPFHVQ